MKEVWLWTAEKFAVTEMDLAVSSAVAKKAPADQVSTILHVRHVMYHPLDRNAVQIGR